MFDEWEKKDPIERWRKRLRKAGLLDADSEKAINDEVRAEVEEANEDAMAQPLPEPGGEIDEVYA